MGKCEICGKKGLFFKVEKCFVCSRKVCPQCTYIKHTINGMHKGSVVPIEANICSIECTSNGWANLKLDYQQWNQYFLDNRQLMIPEFYFIYVEILQKNGNYENTLINNFDGEHQTLYRQDILEHYKGFKWAKGLIKISEGMKMQNMFDVEEGLEEHQSDEILAYKPELKSRAEQLNYHIPKKYADLMRHIASKPNTIKVFLTYKEVFNMFKQESFAKGMIRMHEGYKNLEHSAILEGLKQCRDDDIYHMDESIKAFADDLAELYVEDLKKYDTPKTQISKIIHVDANDLFRQIKSGGLAIPYKCPNCSGTLKIDGGKKITTCPFCDSEIDMETLSDLVKTIL